MYLQNILDPVSKLLSYSIQNAVIKYEHLSNLCYLCNRIFIQVRHLGLVQYFALSVSRNCLKRKMHTHQHPIG